MASSRTMRSTVPVFSSGIRRSMSPNRRLSDSGNHRRFSSSSPFFSTASSSFAAPSSSSSLFQNRSDSSSRVNLGSATTSPSVRFAVAPTTKERQIIRRNHNHNHNHNGGSQQQTHKKRTCMCSPTTHPGSFRCALHKNSGVQQRNVSTTSHRRSGMANSLARAGTVEGGDLMKRVLAALISPSSHQQRRRSSFQPRPSRLSMMSS